MYLATGGQISYTLSVERIVDWTTHKMLPFCSGPTSITSCSHRKDTRLSRHIHICIPEQGSLGMRLLFWDFKLQLKYPMIPNHGVESLIMSWWCNNRNPYGWRKCQVNIQGCNEWICWVRTWTPSPPPSPCEWTHTVPVEKIITFVTNIVYCAREKRLVLLNLISSPASFFGLEKGFGGYWVLSQLLAWTRLWVVLVDCR